MATTLQFGNLPICTNDDEFGNGFQVGYLHFLKDFQGKPISDDLIYAVIVQNMIDVHRTDRNNAGYISGFMFGLMQLQYKS